jgi:hypothetical protein
VFQHVKSHQLPSRDVDINLEIETVVHEDYELALLVG